MPENNNMLLTFFLLCALGGLIYYLTNSCDNNVTNDQNKESFANQTYQPYNFSNAPDSMSNQNNYVQPNVETNMDSNSNPPIDSANASKLTGVFEFEGQNADDASYAGLGDAFAPPLPVGTNPDVVDINRNNVTSYNAKDFLPKEINSDWFDTDFSQAKHTLNDDKLINTERYVIGINTVGESLKNASYDIRGTVPNPKFSVSPWNNSTYEPDYNIKPLC